MRNLEQATLTIAQWSGIHFLTCYVIIRYLQEMGRALIFKLLAIDFGGKVVAAFV